MRENEFTCVRLEILKVIRKHKMRFASEKEIVKLIFMLDTWLRYSRSAFGPKIFRSQLLLQVPGMSRAAFDETVCETLEINNFKNFILFTLKTFPKSRRYQIRCKTQLNTKSHNSLRMCLWVGVFARDCRVVHSKVVNKSNKCVHDNKCSVCIRKLLGSLVSKAGSRLWASNVEPPTQRRAAYRKQSMISRWRRKTSRKRKKSPFVYVKKKIK